MTKTETTGRSALRAWCRPVLIEMIVCGIIGLTASFILSIEAWRLTSNPTTSFSCDVNDVMSCSTVARSSAATVLGFPNAFLGIMFESVVLTVSVATLMGSRFNAIFLRLVNAVYAVALVFALWLFSQSFFVIHALCPWCLTITVTTTLVFSSLTSMNVVTGAIPSSDRVWRFFHKRTDLFIVIGLIIVVATMVVLRYFI